MSFLKRLFGKGDVGGTASDRLDKLQYVAREVAIDLLREHGTVLPLGLILDRDDEVVTHYPDKRECEDPNDAVVSMCLLVLSWLQEQVESGRATGVAIVTELESGDARAIGTQVEVPGAVRAMISPYHQDQDQYVVDSADDVDDGPLLFDKYFPFWGRTS